MGSNYDYRGSILAQDAPQRTAARVIILVSKNPAGSGTADITFQIALRNINTTLGAARYAEKAISNSGRSEQAQVTKGSTTYAMESVPRIVYRNTVNCH